MPGCWRTRRDSGSARDRAPLVTPRPIRGIIDVPRGGFLSRTRPGASRAPCSWGGRPNSISCASNPRTRRCFSRDVLLSGRKDARRLCACPSMGRSWPPSLCPPVSSPQTLRIPVPAANLVAGTNRFTLETEGGTQAELPEYAFPVVLSGAFVSARLEGRDGFRPPPGGDPGPGRRDRPRAGSGRGHAGDLSPPARGRSASRRHGGRPGRRAARAHRGPGRRR